LPISPISASYTQKPRPVLTIITLLSHQDNKTYLQINCQTHQ